MRRMILIWAALSMLLWAEQIDQLLDTYGQKNDLSQQTIDENKGHLVLFTRERLEQMHAKTLKDVFKTTPSIYYNENRYALPDPLSGGLFSPYLSNFIRLYIDGVEVTQGWMGSGLLLYGDLDIDFVDHIEFYYATPSYETATEPAYLTIFLYSKDPERDSGGKIDLIGGSRGYNAQSLSYAGSTERFKYLLNLSHTDAKRQKIPNGTDRALSRDFERTQLFSYIKGEDQFAHLQIMQKRTDALAGLSFDATPLVSKADYLNLHFDYGIAFGENWEAQFTYEWLHTDIKQKDDLPFAFGRNIPLTQLYAKVKNSTYSAELTYNKKYGAHHVTAGVKGRVKQLDMFKIEGVGNVTPDFDEETILSAFLQDQYLLSESALLSFGVEYSKLLRNATIDNDDLLQIRVGYIFHRNHWSYKTYLYRTMFALDPFSRYLGSTNPSDIPSQSTIGITQELSYTDEKSRARLMLLLMKDKNGLVQSQGTGTGNTKYFFSILNYDYNFDTENMLKTQFYYARYKDIFFLDKLEDYSGYVSLFNSYDNFDFYNGVVWHQNSIDHKNFFDLTSTISWNATENLTLTLKGDNLLDKAKETRMLRIDPTSGTPLAPLSVSPIDRRVTIELEYTF